MPNPVPVTSNALCARDYKGARPEADQGAPLIPTIMRQREGKPGGGKGPLLSEGVSLTLAAAQDQVLFAQTQAVAYSAPVVMAVRRLTPEECERLQGFPDGYTNIPRKGKPESPDGPRYKALGNSMAVPVMRWIGERIKLVEELP